MRTLEEIKDDPMATEEEVTALPPELAIMHPNCPQDLWWLLAEVYPMEAQESPAGQLFLLEDPARWIEVRRIWRHVWVRRGADELPPTERILFATDCAEHVLPFVTQKYPDDSLVRNAIHVRRQFARGLANAEQWTEAKTAAREMIDLTLRSGGVRDAAHTALLAATEDAARSVVDYAVEAAARAARNQVRATQVYLDDPLNEAMNTAFQSAQAAERDWQWSHLITYKKARLK